MSGFVELWTCPQADNPERQHDEKAVAISDTDIEASQAGSGYRRRNQTGATAKPGGQAGAVDLSETGGVEAAPHVVGEPGNTDAGSRRGGHQPAIREAPAQPDRVGGKVP